MSDPGAADVSRETREVKMDKRGMRLRLKIYRSIPWLLFGAVLLPALATMVVGITTLALWDAAGDIALGVLTLVFSVFALTGAILTLVLLVRQNRLNRSQSDFIAQVSHELRTPLSSIKMYVETLSMGRFRSEEERDGCVSALERETERLHTLVAQILGFQRQSQPVEGLSSLALPALVEEVLEPFKRHADYVDRIYLVAEPALPRVHVARDSFVSALQNLLQNALSHGGEGVVVVTVRGDNGGVAIDVRDEGPGVSEADHKRIFRRFERGTSTTTSGIPGFGLGLAIVQEYADRAGGRVAVKNGPERGAIFTLWLPAR